MQIIFHASHAFAAEIRRCRSAPCNIQSGSDAALEQCIHHGYRTLQYGSFKGVAKISLWESARLTISDAIRATTGLFGTDLAVSVCKEASCPKPMVPTALSQKILNVMLNQTFHYMVASIVSAAVGLLSAVVFTRLLSPEEYGVYVVGLSTAGIVSAMLFTWVRVSALRFQSEGGSVDVRATILLAYLISVLAAPVAFLIATLTSSISAERTLAAIFFALGLGLFELGQELLKARLQSFAFMFASITRACVAFLLCLGAALLGGGGLSQLAMVTLTYFITTSLFAMTIWRSPVAALNISDLRAFAKFGIPITLSGIVFALHAALDRMLIFHLMGDNAAGHYGASADLVRQIILIPAVSIASATIPLAVRAFADGGAQQARPHLEFSFEILLAAVLPAVVGVALTSNYIAGVVLGSDFRDTAAQIMPILAFAWLFQSISQSYIHASFHLAKTPFLMTLQSVGMLLVNLLTMPVLIAKFGLAGAASGLVAAEAFGASFGWFLTRKAFPLPFNGFQVLRIASATAIMALVLTALKPSLPVGILSFCILAGCGCLTYLAAAMAFDIAGLRKAATAYGSRRGLWPLGRKSEVARRVIPATTISSRSTALSSMPTSEP